MPFSVDIDSFPAALGFKNSAFPALAFKEAKLNVLGRKGKES